MDEHPAVEKDEMFDASDLSFIRNLAAIGDSYSAGIGAGERLGSVWTALDPKSGMYNTYATITSLYERATPKLTDSSQDYACSRYDQSYPYLVYTDERLGGDSPPNWQFLSCSGAVAQDVLDKQIPDLNPGQQAIMLSIGRAICLDRPAYTYSHIVG
jgi:hypothetical protein